MKISRKMGVVIMVVMAFLMASCASSKKRTFRKARKNYKKFRDYDCGCWNTKQNSVTFELLNGQEAV